MFVRLIGVAAGQLHQGQHHQLLHHIARMCILLVQKLGGLGLQVFQGVQQLGGHQLHCIASGHGAVVFHGQARFAPHFQRFDFAVFQQPFRRQRTAVIGLQHRAPQAENFFDAVRAKHSGVFLVAQHQLIAAQLAVVTHAVMHLFGLKSGPIASVAQQHQPIIAQAVFLVGACVTAEKLAHLAGGRVVQAGAQFPIRGPRFEHMAPHLGQQVGQAPAVVAFEGIGHLQQGSLSWALIHGPSLGMGCWGEWGGQGQPHKQ